MPFTYGGCSKLTDFRPGVVTPATPDGADVRTCPRCDGPIDKHTIPFIRSEETTLKMCLDFAKYLETNSVAPKSGRAARVYARGGAPAESSSAPASTVTVDRAQMMIGAVLAIVGSETLKFVAVSGDVPERARGYTAGAKLVDLRNARQGAQHKLLDIRGNWFKPVIDKILVDSNTWEATGGTDTCAVGQCAAPKLLRSVFEHAVNKGKPVSKIEMTEIWYRDPYAEERLAEAGKEPVRMQGGLRDTQGWVISCNTCRWVLPQMLCDKAG
jgi:hypothetical protein